MWLAQEDLAYNYRAIVNKSLTDSYTFSNFKNIRAYAEIVSQHPPYGPVYYERIINEAPKQLISKLPQIAKCDTLGNPTVKEYVNQEFFPGGLKISACNLRYVNTVMEIDRYFNFGNKKLSIVELGVGFGGLCFAASQWFNVDKYYLLDLENVQALATKCLDLLGNTTHTTSPPEHTDLLISEYCLSEFSDSLIDYYYVRFVQKAERVYLRFNLHEEQRKAAFLEKLGKDFNFVVEEEWPKTQWPNYVIIGTKK